MNEEFQSQFDTSIKDYAASSQFSVVSVPAHTHNKTDSLAINFKNLENKERFIIIRILDAASSTTVSNTVGGDFVMPFMGSINLIGATVDTAGTTGNTTIDINLNGSSICSTKITINSATKTSRVATTKPVINAINKTFNIGDILTFDVDGISTTPAKGLTIFMNVIDTSK